MRKVTPTLLKKKLWEIMKQTVREKYGNTCYTCNKTGLSGSNWHTGHMWAKSTLSAHLAYDIRVLRPQCFFCNIHAGGQGAMFYARMLKEIGKSAMAKLEKEKDILVKADTLFYQKKLDEAVAQLKQVILQQRK